MCIRDSFWGSLALLLGGYFVYGAFVEKVFGADFGRLTPVKSRRDGVDYIELPRYKIFLIQLLNIAGLGPVIGPILGAVSYTHLITLPESSTCGVSQKHQSGPAAQRPERMPASCRAVRRHSSNSRAKACCATASVP